MRSQSRHAQPRDQLCDMHSRPKPSSTVQLAVYMYTIHCMSTMDCLSLQYLEGCLLTSRLQVNWSLWQHAYMGCVTTAQRDPNASESLSLLPTCASAEAESWDAVCLSYGCSSCTVAVAFSEKHLLCAVFTKDDSMKQPLVKHSKE